MKEESKMNKFIALLLVGIIFTGCASTKVTINTNVPDAKVIVDGKVLGQTPINKVKIKNTSGRYQSVIIEKEGYKTFQGNLAKEDKGGAQAAVIVGYSLGILILPLLLLINLKYIAGPVPDQYFILEKDE